MDESRDEYRQPLTDERLVALLEDWRDFYNAGTPVAQADALLTFSNQIYHLGCDLTGDITWAGVPDEGPAPALTLAPVAPPVRGPEPPFIVADLHAEDDHGDNWAIVPRSHPFDQVLRPGARTTAGDGENWSEVVVVGVELLDGADGPGDRLLVRFRQTHLLPDQPDPGGLDVEPGRVVLDEPTASAAKADDRPRKAMVVERAGRVAVVLGVPYTEGPDGEHLLDEAEVVAVDALFRVMVARHRFSVHSYGGYVHRFEELIPVSLHRMGVYWLRAERDEALEMVRDLWRVLPEEGRDALGYEPPPEQLCPLLVVGEGADLTVGAEATVPAMGQERLLPGDRVRLVPDRNTEPVPGVVVSAGDDTVVVRIVDAP